MKMRSIGVSLAALFIVAAFSFEGVHAQALGTGRGLPSNNGNYSITGKVMLPNGAPAVGAKVDATCDFSSAATNTADDGTYRITGISAGNCVVHAKVEGFEIATEYRTIERDTPQGQAVFVPFFIRASAANLASNPQFAGVPKSAIDKYKTAVEKLEKGDADAALKGLDEAIALHPRFAQAWFQRGNALRKKGDNDRAIEAFVKAIEIKPDYIEAKYAFGLAQLEKKNYAVSEAVFRDVINEIADMAEAHQNLGISLFYLKKTDEAETELKNAIERKGGEKLPLAHLYLGQIYAQKKRNAEAVDQLQKYLEILPKAPNADRIKSAIADLKKQS